MSKQLLIELFTFTPTSQFLSEAKTNSNGKFMLTGKLQEAGVVNANRRVYELKTLQREVEKYQQAIKENRAVGELDHPESSVINLKNVSHCIRKTWWDGSNLYGDIEILPTPSGNIAKALIMAGVTLGISSRALGTTEPLGEGTVKVGDDLELIGWDIVSTPSTPGAYVAPKSKIQESYNPGLELKYDTKINSLIRDILCDQTGTCCLR